jgi:FRG domain
VREKRAKSIGDVMAVVSDARREWKLREDQELWFRGENIKHRSSTLVPKLYRHLNDDIQVVSKTLLREEKNFHEEFQRCGAQLYSQNDVDEWDWYFLMQHHNAPTRLLDWSDGALMAVHFAIRSDLSSNEGGYVYVLDPYQLLRDLADRPSTAAIKQSWKAYRGHRRKTGRKWPRAWDEVYLPGMHSLTGSPTSKRKSHSTPTKPELPNEPLVLEFPQITRRVAAQRSRFMVYGKDRNWLTQWAKKDIARIWRITIPKNRVIGIKTELRDAGITESVIFPDLDGLGRELDQLWDNLKRKPHFKR